MLFEMVKNEDENNNGSRKTLLFVADASMVLEGTGAENESIYHDYCTERNFWVFFEEVETLCQEPA